MRSLLTPLKETTEFKSLARGLSKNLAQQLLFGLSGAQRSYVTAGLFDVTDGPLMVIVPGEQEAGTISDDLAALLPDTPVYQFPIWQLLPYQVLAHGKEVLAQRLRVMEALCRGQRAVVVAPVEALLRRITPSEVWGRSVIRLSPGDRVDMERLLRTLAA